MAADMGGALAGASVAVGLSFGLVELTTDDCDENDEGLCGFGRGVTMLGVAGGLELFLAPAGTVVVGNAMGGQGAYGWTMLGNAVGMVGGALIAVPTAGVGFVAAVLAGNVLGYELSSAAYNPPKVAPPPRSFSWQPRFAVTRDTAFFGADGTF